MSFAGHELHAASGKVLGVLGAFAKHPISDEDFAFLSNMAETTSKVILDSQAEEELREKRRQAVAANRLKSEFLANMSHEIRTPMTAILGFSDLLMSPSLAEDERNTFLEAIHRNGKSLLELINGILDLSRIEADKLVLEKSFCPLHQIVDDATSAVRLQAEEKRLKLEVAYHCPLPESVYTDPIRLHQILVNLMGNAVKFTERGAVRVGVRCVCEDDKARRIAFVVSDTGIGIPAEKIGELFQPFTQVDGSTTRRYGGTGLGLAISKRLATALGGDIEVTSNVGKGSTFRLTIDGGPVDEKPIMQVAPPTAGELHAAIEPSRPVQLHGRILLAEDVSDVRLAVEKLLRQINLNVDVVADGYLVCEAAERSKQQHRPYDAILMDIQMPGQNGYEATKWLRSHGWRGPIVALTAHAMAGDREECLRAGCDDYFVEADRRRTALRSAAAIAAGRR